MIGIGFGLNEIGLFALFQAKVFFLATFIKFGFSQSTYQLASQNSDTTSTNLQIFHIWSVFFILLFMALIAAINLLQLVYPSNFILIFVSALMLSWISVESALRLPNYSPLRALAIEDIIPGIIFIILISIFILLKAEVEIIHLYFLSLTPSMAFALISRCKDLNYKKLNFLGDIVPTVKKNLSFFMINASQVTNSHGALLLLGFISNPAFSGSYRVAMAIISVCSIISSSLATELQRIASKEELSEILKKKNQFTLINLLVSFLMLFTLIIAHNLMYIFNTPNVEIIIELSILLNSILFLKAFIGFPDPILIAKGEEYYISRIFIIIALLFFGIASSVIAFGGTSTYLVIFIIALIQPTAIIFYAHYLKKKYGIRSYLTLHKVLKN